MENSRVIGIRAEGSTVTVSTNATAMEMEDAIYFANKCISEGGCCSTFYSNIERYLKRRGKRIEIHEGDEVYDGDNNVRPDKVLDEELIESLLEEFRQEEGL